MEITWYGHSCFRLRGKEATVVTDPYGPDYGYTLPHIRAEIVTISHHHPDHDYARGIKGNPKVIEGPGEYEIRGVFITGIPTFHDRRQGKDRGSNTVFLFDIDDLRVCHLGDLGHVLDQSQVEALGDIDVLLIPVGSVYTINAAQAAEVVSLLEPKIVIPMHYKTKASTVKLDPVRKFLKEMGMEELAPQESLKVTKGSLPEETQVVVLQYRQ